MLCAEHGTVSRDWLIQTLRAAVPRAQLAFAETPEALLQTLEQSAEFEEELPAFLLLPPDGEVTIRLVQQLKSRERLRMIPIVAFTFGGEWREELYDAQVNCCIATEAWSADKLEILSHVFDFWLTVAVLPANLPVPVITKAEAARARAIRSSAVASASIK